MNWYLEVLKKYAVFNGRARRKEYWMFILFDFIIMFVLGFVEGFVEALVGGSSVISIISIISHIYSLVVLIPRIAVGVRRMHDSNHSGWWLLLPIVNLVFACREGTRGDNRFGPDPKAGV